MASARTPRPVRIARIARRFTYLRERFRFAQDFSRGAKPGKAHERSVKKPFRRKLSRPRVRTLIAYDLETTRIREGTPQPLYMTWFGEGVAGSIKVDSLRHLGEIIATRLLVPEFNRARFVAWNGNNFDVYLVAAALLDNPAFVLRPYLTRSKNLRGLRVTREIAPDKRDSWEFLDGMAMTGASAWPDKRLKFFLERFAPQYGKLAGPDFEHEEFDAGNVDHVRYAERDSEGLFYAMQNAQAIVYNTFGVPLNPTIGNTGIRIFQRHMPDQVAVWEPPYSALSIIRDTVMRGGFCFCVRKFEGPVWKYDINQAYAAAMRETWLPAGRCIHTDTVHPYANAAIYRIEAAKPDNRVPFYYRDVAGDAVFGMDRITDTWITIEELQQLQRERWRVNVIEGWFWDEVFTMRDYVNQLERLRMTADGGPNGAIGLMVKAIGNNSYGKTVERLEGLELVLARDKPEGYFAYQDEDDLFRHVWAKLSKPVPREYHQPQLGAFITAHVRMVLRRAILADVDAWLYADTDGLMFSRPVELNLDAKRYGFWKLEEAGTPYRIINKKVYATVETVEDRDRAGNIVRVRPKSAHAKGLNVRLLSAHEFSEWLAGRPPEQKQIQRQNFIKVMMGFDMFAERIKVGEVSTYTQNRPDS